MQGGQQDGAFVLAQARDALGHEQLRELPADRVDGRHQADQQGGIGHGGDEEGQDGTERCEAKRDAEQAAIPQIDDQVVLQVLPDLLFEGGEHGWIVTESAPNLRKCHVFA